MFALREPFEKLKMVYIQLWSIYNERKEVITPEGITIKMNELDNSDAIMNLDVDKRNLPCNQRGWVREEMVVLVSEYFRTKNLSNSEQKRSIERVSQILRKRAIQNGENISDVFRNINGISMQFGFIKKFDKDIESKGLGNGSKLMQEIVNEYFISPETIQKEAECVIMRVLSEKH